MSFLPNLEAEMLRCSIEEEDIAQAASCSVETVQTWFSGESEPSFGQAKAIRDKKFPAMNIEYLFQMDYSEN